MPHRIHNFNAGPAALPLEVLDEIQGELLDFHGRVCPFSRSATDRSGSMMS